MTEEVKQALVDAAQDTCNGVWMKTVIEKAEAKLSPKHPPAGRICETWDDNNLSGGAYGHEIHVSAGDGTFGSWADGRAYSENIKQDHYREIVTAEDALDAVCHVVIDEAGNMYAGQNKCIDAIQALIDNAATG